MVSRVTYKDIVDSAPCAPCVISKIQRLPFRYHEKKAEKVLELIHSDLCGLIENSSIGRFKYFLTFIDDHSRRVTIFS